MTQTLTPPSAVEPDSNPEQPESLLRTLINRISRLEIAVGAVIAVVLLALVVIEPDIVEAPFENANTLLFTLGGTLLAAGVFIAMLWGKVPPAVRIVVLVVPFALVNWWLLSPYFVDDVVDEEFSTSIASQLAAAPDADPEPAAAPATTAPVSDANSSDTGAEADASPEPQAETTAPAPDAAESAETAGSDEAAAPAAPEETIEEEAEPPAPEPPSGPVLIAAGQFVGLAGHDGVGDAGIFENPDGSYTLRFENFDIENGPDLDVYLVPGADQTSLAEGSIDLGDLKGNIGDQNYELPAGTELSSGAWTVLVWCEAFSVEFVGATVTV